MDRIKHLNCADEALRRAENLAGDAEDAARSFDHRHKAEPLAAAGNLWAQIARAHTAIAAAKTETEPADG